MFDDLREFVQDTEIARTNDVVRAELFREVGRLQQVLCCKRPAMMVVVAVTVAVIGHDVTAIRLAAQAEVGDELAVALEIFVLKIAQQAPALSDLHQQAAAAVVVLLVDLQMLGQLVDRRGEDGDLNVGRTGVVGAAAEFGRDLRLLFFGQGHGIFKLS